jgi:hypothetical protein
VAALDKSQQPEKPDRFAARMMPVIATRPNASSKPPPEPTREASLLGCEDETQPLAMLPIFSSKDSLPHLSQAPSLFQYLLNPYFGGSSGWLKSYKF